MDKHNIGSAPRTIVAFFEVYFILNLPKNYKKLSFSILN